jgi:hypothetical protein
MYKYIKNIYYGLLSYDAVRSGRKVLVFRGKNASICGGNPEDYNEVLTALSVTLAVRRVLSPSSFKEEQSFLQVVP